MGRIIFNYSDEEFIPSKNGIYIKRFSKYKDDAFIYALKEFLEANNYDGVIYVGEPKSDIPFENFNQEYWDKGVIKYVRNVIIFMSGKEMTLTTPEVKEYLIYSYAQLKKYKNKNIMYNFVRFDAGSDEEYKELKRMIDRIIELREKEL
ncbi:MAG: hypothetical protein MJ244_05270 [Clostridia bacterium]|nr:hypothetical protein [Clostridia bacterium]